MDDGRGYNRFLARLVATDERKRLFVDRVFFLQARLARIVRMLKSFEECRIFLTKVSKKGAPGYYEVIKRPMDLGTVQRRLWRYRSFEEFKEDLDLIWSNCLEFNEGKYYRDCATRMRDVASSLEIEVAPVVMDAGFLRASKVGEGREQYGVVARDALRRVVGKALVSAGYVFASRDALEVFGDVLQRKAIEIIRREAVAREEPGSQQEF